jgi:hypothetical protein
MIHEMKLPAMKTWKSKVSLMSPDRFANATNDDESVGLRFKRWSFIGRNIIERVTKGSLEDAMSL